MPNTPDVHQLGRELHTAVAAWDEATVAQRQTWQRHFVAQLSVPGAGPDDCLLAALCAVGLTDTAGAPGASARATLAAAALRLAPLPA